MPVRGRSLKAARADSPGQQQSPARGSASARSAASPARTKAAASAAAGRAKSPAKHKAAASPARAKSPAASKGKASASPAPVRSRAKPAASPARAKPTKPVAPKTPVSAVKPSRTPKKKEEVPPSPTVSATESESSTSESETSEIEAPVVHQRSPLPGLQPPKLKPVEAPSHSEPIVTAQPEPVCEAPVPPAAVPALAPSSAPRSQSEEALFAVAGTAGLAYTMYAQMGFTGPEAFLKPSVLMLLGAVPVAALAAALYRRVHDHGKELHPVVSAMLGFFVFSTLRGEFAVPSQRFYFMPHAHAWFSCAGNGELL